MGVMRVLGQMKISCCLYCKKKFLHNLKKKSVKKPSDKSLAVYSIRTIYSRMFGWIFNFAIKSVGFRIFGSFQFIQEVNTKKNVVNWTINCSKQNWNNCDQKYVWAKTISRHCHWVRNSWHLNYAKKWWAWIFNFSFIMTRAYQIRKG